jgi:hypothetical protein
MEKKQIEVDCPCCSAHLSIDVLTRTVTRATPRAELGEDGKPRRDGAAWERASGAVEMRSAGATDKLESALEAERSKADRFDDLFDKARKKVQERQDDSDFPNQSRER